MEGTEKMNIERPTSNIEWEKMKKQRKVELGMRKAEEEGGWEDGKMKGDRKGQYSIRINDQYRILFNWENENALDVEIADYH